MSPALATDPPLIRILTDALEAAGVPTEEITKLLPAEQRKGVKTDYERRALSLATHLVNSLKEKAVESGSDSVVGCFFMDNGMNCVLNLPDNNWQTIKAQHDPNATSGAPVAPHDQGWFPA
jgi:hypothetical protein